MPGKTPMNELLTLTPPFAAGLLLGAFFFGALHWTVAMAVSSRRPALWVLGSLALRMTITLAGFLLVGGRDWERWLSCLLAFIVARIAVMRRTRPRENLCAP